MHNESRPQLASLAGFADTRTAASRSPRSVQTIRGHAKAQHNTARVGTATMDLYGGYAQR